MAFNGVPFEQLGVPWHRPIAIPLPPHEVLEAPNGTWGIAYDLFTRNIEDLPGAGWGSRRGKLIHVSVSNGDPSLMNENNAGTVYNKIARILTVNNFAREQYSLWQRDGSAEHTWTTMMRLRQIRPPGIFATIVKGLQMYLVPRPDILIVADHVQLGGIFAPELSGPTPAALAQGMGHVPPAPWPNGPEDRLPIGVRDHPMSRDRNNWRIG